MASPRPLLSFEANSPFRNSPHGKIQHHRIMPHAPWQKNDAIPPWQQNAQPVSNFPVPPTLAAGRLLGPTPIQSLLSSSLPASNLRSLHMNSNHNQPRSLMDHVVTPGMSSLMNADRNEFKQSPSPYTRKKQDQRRYSSPKQQSTKAAKTPDEKMSSDLEKKALEGEITEEFFRKVKSMNSMKLAVNLALQNARQEFFTAKGLPVPDGKNPTGVGNNICTICSMRCLSRDQLEKHYNNPDHKALEDSFMIKKHQARLIIDNKLPHPGDVKKPDVSMVAVARAEVEMNLKPSEMDLDSYLLGIYESIMKPYWPIPKSQHYCRICNYIEFRNQAELERHSSSREHQRREETYSEAFCLFCQVHNVDAILMKKHETSAKHCEAKDLMEKTKECAIKHWHKVNGVALPGKFIGEEENRGMDHSPKVGDKRSAPVLPEEVSPMKKISASKSYSSQGKNAGDRYGSKEVKDKNESSQQERKVDSKEKYNSSAASAELNPALTDKTKMWFAPVRGFVCVACHTFIANEADQKSHLMEAFHQVNVAKFKKLLSNS